MPHYYSTVGWSPPPLSPAAKRQARREALSYPKTRFLVDENIEPWAIYVMRHKAHDVMSADAAGIRNRDDREVFLRAWQLKRVLVTHDNDFVDDQEFPFATCSGLVVLPVYSSVSLEFANLISSSLGLIAQGASLWFHTKMVVSRRFIVNVKTWEKSKGFISRWSFNAPIPEEVKPFLRGRLHARQRGRKSDGHEPEG